jgi:hypothetical protein
MTVRFIFFLLIVLQFSGCLGTGTTCCDYEGSFPISKGLYVEEYKTFCAGVLGDLTECYLTDSVSFRQKIGSFDEHEWLRAKLRGDNIVETYNVTSLNIPDTIEKKTILKSELSQYHHADTSLLAATPIFGKNTIKCNTDFYPASSYKTDDGYYMTEVQYKCDYKMSNAVFYTDSLNFSVFIGVYIPGSWSNNYSVKMNTATNSFDFYNVEFKNKVDTVKSETFLLTDLKKGKLIKVCK